MEINLTSKLRIVFQSEDDRKSAFDTLIAYRDACNYVSQYIFNHDFVLKQSDLQSALYHELRKQFGLKSQMTQSVFKTVIARYKTVQTQLRKQRVWDVYKKDNHGKEIPNYINKDLTFLWKPIEFKRPQLDLVRNRDYSFKNNVLSMNTINGRIHVQIHGLLENPYFDGSWNLGTGKVVRSGKHWFFHLAASKDDVNHKLHHTRMASRRFDTQGRHILTKGSDVLVRNLLRRDAFFLGTVDNLIIHIRKIGNIGNLITTVFEITTNGIKSYRRTSIPHVDIVVHGWPTDIHLNLTVLNRDKFTQSAGHSVVNFNHEVLLSRPYRIRISVGYLCAYQAMVRVFQICHDQYSHKSRMSKPIISYRHYLVHRLELRGYHWSS